MRILCTKYTGIFLVISFPFTRKLARFGPYDATRFLACFWFFLSFLFFSLFPFFFTVFHEQFKNTHLSLQNGESIHQSRSRSALFHALFLFTLQTKTSMRLVSRINCFMKEFCSLSSKHFIFTISVSDQKKKTMKY